VVNIYKEAFQAKELVADLNTMLKHVELYGQEQIFNQLIKLDNCVLDMLSKMEKK
jgi:hypothetical protein